MGGLVETFGQSLSEVVGPLADLVRWTSAQAFGPEVQKYWLWMAGGLIAIDLFYRCWSRPPSESFWSYSAHWRIYRHASAVMEYKFVVVRQLVNTILLAPLIVSALALANWGSKLLVSWLGPGPDWTPGPVALVIFSAIAVVLIDVGHYISHYIQHKVPFFWEFHKIHHAAEVLTPITAFRAHPVELILDSLFQNSMQALALAAFFYLYGGQHLVMAFVWVNVLLFLFFLIDNLRHTHVWISFGPALEHFISSPAQHQIHHSSAPQHLDTNLAQYFSFLDWIAGTLYIAREGETLEFGLFEGPDPELNTVWSWYWVPFKRAFRRLLPSRDASAPAQLV